jgi:cell division protein FtsW
MRNAATYLRHWLSRSEGLSDRMPDPYLAAPAFGLLVLGVLMVLNTTYFPSLERTGDGFHLFKLHLCHVALGFLTMAVLSQFSLQGLRRLTPLLMLAAAAMLIALWIPGLGVVRGGARRWLRLGGFLAQPSELVKLASVFFLADFLSRRQERMGAFGSAVVLPAIVIGSFGLLLLEQPDFGATVLVISLLFAMLFAAGARPQHLAALGAPTFAVLALQAVLKSYRLQRLESFLHPWQRARGAGFQLVQSLIALGTGGEWGVGLGAGRQKMFYLPQASTDFVFAVVGEELGAAGAGAVLLLFGAVMWRGMRIAREEPDPFASLLAGGLTALLSMQALANVAVVLGLVPTKGLPLPFVSYGGTSTVVMMAALGVLFALARRPAVR